MTPPGGPGPAPTPEPKKSGYLPVDCIPLAVTASPFLLDCWLDRLIGKRKFHRWFVQASDTEAGENVGRQPQELAIATPPPALVSNYCADLLAGESPASGAVYDTYDED